MALRLLAFKNIYKILGIDCLNMSQNTARMPRKRQLVQSEPNESPGNYKLYASFAYYSN